MKESIGFVGVGLMGHGMAKSILEAGYPLTVIAHTNRTPVEDLLARGASEANTLEDLGSKSSIIHICAPGSPEVEKIVSTLMKSMKPDSVIVDCSTSDPNSTISLAEQLNDAGFHIADAPLGGTPVQAEKGELSTMVGADDEIFERVRPVIGAWAQAIAHIGPIGAGHKMKLLNNFLSLGYAALYSEALALSEKVGISDEQFDSVIGGSRMDCGFYQTFMECVVGGNREAHKFTLKNALKDLLYLESMADSVTLANPIGNAVKNSFAQAILAGHNGPQDYVPHLAEHVKKLNGMS